jgi:quercetin dioxygenase-like cupin family protein
MRPTAAKKPLRFVTAKTARIERAPWGRHWWLSESALTGTTLLTLVRVTMRPGTGHRFHHHPEREEIIYVVDGVAEQWVGTEKRRLKAGECAFIPKKVVHAIFNSSKKPMTFLAILSPAKAKGPFLVDCYDQEPWKSLRPSPATRREARASGRSLRRGAPARRRPRPSRRRA